MKVQFLLWQGEAAEEAEEVTKDIPLEEFNYLLEYLKEGNFIKFCNKEYYLDELESGFEIGELTKKEDCSELYYVISLLTKEQKMKLRELKKSEDSEASLYGLTKEQLEKIKEKGIICDF
jgi:hypothetical protein